MASATQLEDLHWDFLAPGFGPDLAPASVGLCGSEWADVNSAASPTDECGPASHTTASYKNKV